MLNDPLQAEPFQLVADQVPAMLWRISADFLHDWANKCWFDFTGGSLDEERGFAWVEKVHPDDRQMLTDELDRAFAARQPLMVDFRIKSGRGNYHWFRNCGSPVYRDGKFDGFVGSCVDVTDIISATERLDRFQKNVETALQHSRGGDQAGERNTGRGLDGSTLH
jgi:PAS domain S-box-containing protein